MPLTWLQKFWMRLRDTPVPLIESALEQSDREDLGLTADDLETHYMVGGDVIGLVQSYAVARRAGLPVEWMTLAAIDIGNGDPMEFVESGADPEWLREFNATLQAE